MLPHPIPDQPIRPSQSPRSVPTPFSTSRAAGTVALNQYSLNDQPGWPISLVAGVPLGSVRRARSRRRSGDLGGIWGPRSAGFGNQCLACDLLLRARLPAGPLHRPHRGPDADRRRGRPHVMSVSPGTAVGQYARIGIDETGRRVRVLIQIWAGDRQVISATFPSPSGACVCQWGAPVSYAGASGGLCRPPRIRRRSSRPSDP